MENILRYLNENPGVGIIIAAIAILVTVIGWFIKKEKQKNMNDNSSHIHAGGDIKSGGHIIVGNSNVIGSTNLPEFHLQLSGSGAKQVIEGHIEKQGGPTLVAETIEINGQQTTLNQQFTKLFYLNNLNFPADLFTTKTQNINVALTGAPSI